MGYFKERIPLLDCASSPTWASLLPIPTMTPGYFGLPTTEGKTARGASSPAKPALTMPDPLSMTIAAASSSSHILAVVRVSRVEEINLLFLLVLLLVLL